MNIAITKATEKDLEKIHQLAGEIWRKHYPGIISTEQINYMLDKMYSTTTLKNQFDKGMQFYIVSYKESAMGYFAYSITEETNYFLHKIYIKPEYQGFGTGKTLLNYIFNLMTSESELRLQVNRKNFKSINFYFKAGFIIENVLDTDIGQGYMMEDFVMIKGKSVKK